jgi:hypothetical protein
MKAISGNPETHRSVVRVATKRGLPLIVPSHLRTHIEIGNVKSTRLVLTILSMYRVIKCPPKYKINTITDPFKGDSEVLLPKEVFNALDVFDYKTVRLIPNARLQPIVKAGPNRSISCMGTIFDAYAFKYNYPHLIPHLKAVTDTTGNEI